MPSDQGPPLIVDLDGILTQADTLTKTPFLRARDQPLAPLWAFVDLNQNRTSIKACLAALDLPNLPPITRPT